MSTIFSARRSSLRMHVCESNGVHCACLTQTQCWMELLESEQTTSGQMNQTMLLTAKTKKPNVRKMLDKILDGNQASNQMNQRRCIQQQQQKQCLPCPWHFKVCQ